MIGLTCLEHSGWKGLQHAACTNCLAGKGLAGISFLEQEVSK